jgi:hypothetical protein
MYKFIHIFAFVNKSNRECFENAAYFLGGVIEHELGWFV